jgi:hypothetical protein
MSEEIPATEQVKPEPTSSIWGDLRSAGLLTVGIIAVVAFLTYAIYIQLSPITYEKLGQIGDSFGALTSLFNALAFAALVATVVLQGRELRESRQELVKQARAQEAWAKAAAEQIKLTQQLEAIRIRPFIKIEWHPYKDVKGMFELRMRNVGLGVAIVQSFEIWARGQVFGTLFRHEGETSRKAWEDSLKLAAGKGGERIEITVLQFDDRNRALAPGEFQAVVYVDFHGENEVAWAAQREISLSHELIVHFCAADGKSFSTYDQYDEMTADPNPRAINR